MFYFYYLTLVLGSRSQNTSSHSNSTKSYSATYDPICDVNVLDEASDLYKREALNKYNSLNTKENSGYKSGSYTDFKINSKPALKSSEESEDLKAINPWSMHLMSKSPSKSPKTDYGKSNNSKYSYLKEHSYSSIKK